MKYTIPFAALLFVGACADPAPKAEVQQTREDRLAEIKQLETEFNPSADFDDRQTQARADILTKRYRDFVNLNPTDSATPHFLFKAARLSVGLKRYDAAIAYCDRIIKEFDVAQRFEQTPQVMLFKAFVYEVNLNNYAEASVAYEALIARFPNHPLAEDARAARHNLSLSEEELLEKLRDGRKGA